MKIKLKYKSKLIGDENSMYGFTPNDRALLNQGKTIEINKIPAIGEDLVIEVKEKKNGNK